MKITQSISGFLSVVITLMFCTHLIAQQISPIELTMEPEKYDIFFSGTGGGDFNNLNVRTANPSAQGMVEAVFFNKTTKQNRYLSLPLIARWNFFPASKIVSRDSFSARTLAFVDNNQLFNFGIRLRNVGSGETDRIMHGPTLDFSYNSYNLQDSSMTDIKMESLNFLGGYQLAFLKDAQIGKIGFTLSANGSFINVIDKVPNAFEIAMRQSLPLSRNFAGAGGKLQVQINDIAIFFECKKVFPLDNARNVQGFSDKTIISFGGNAVGSILKSKRKE